MHVSTTNFFSFIFFISDGILEVHRQFFKNKNSFQEMPSRSHCRFIAIEPQMSQLRHDQKNGMANLLKIPVQKILFKEFAS